MMSKIAVLIVFSLFTLSNSLFFGCCGAPQIQTCCQSTSWAYAPPRVIGYERIPLYAKVPVAAPPQYPTMSPPTNNYPPPPPPPMPQYNTPYEVAPMSGSTFGRFPGSSGTGGMSGSSFLNSGSSFGSLPGSSGMGGSSGSSFSSSGSSLPPPSGSFVGPPGSISASHSPNQIPQVIKLPSSDGYSEGDTIIIETDDHRLKRYNVMPPPPPPPPQAPIGYIQPQQQQVAGSNYLPQQSPLINGGQVENGVEVTLDQINSNQLPVSNYGAQSSSLIQSSAASAAAGYESSGLIAPAARRLRKHKN